MYDQRASDQYAFFFVTCNSKASELKWHIVVGTMAEIIIIWSGPLDYEYSWAG
jgi:hypothetical protein